MSRAAVALVLALTACGPSLADFGDGETGTGDEAELLVDPGNGRLRLVEFQCIDGECVGRWEGTSRWSLVSDADDVAGSVEISSPWSCTRNLDVDVCIEVDVQGHVGCFWYQDGLAVAVAPSCAVDGKAWTDIGNGMVALSI